MDIDVADRIGAVTREVQSREHDGRLARVVVASRVYDTAVEDVWDALTNLDRIPRWFLPVSGDLQPGGRYQLEGNAAGEIIRCEPPRLLQVTWEFGDDVSWLAVRLREHTEDSTHLELEHVAHVDDERWAQYGPGAVGVGWDLALLGLGEHLATGATQDPQEAMAWSMSEQGKDFVQRSSDAWCRASIASGTESAAADSAAKRTTDFYTGVDVPTEAPSG